VVAITRFEVAVEVKVAVRTAVLASMTTRLAVALESFNMGDSPES
jgi:hypothetical protein